MHASRRFRLPALIAGIAVIAALTPALPALADDPPADPTTPAVEAGAYPTASPGGVTISNSVTPFVATPDSWPSGTTFTYQWYRGATAATATTAATGAGAATASYTPNAADWNQFLRVRVAATVPGFSPAAVRYSTPAYNYSILSSSAIAITGTPKVGTQVTVSTGGLTYTDAQGFAMPVGILTLSYQWLRNGVPITDTPAATTDATDDADYTLRGLDLNANVTLRITASKPGYVSRVLTTPNFKPTQAGTIQATTPTAAIDRISDASAPLHVAFTATVAGVTEPDVTFAYQWYRVNRTTNAATAISGATAQSYRPVASDYAYDFRAVVSVKKTGYTTLPLTSPDRDFSLRIGGTGLAVVGTPQVGQTLSVNDPEFAAMFPNGSYGGLHYSSPGMSPTFQWRRAGVNIPGATGSSYTLVGADAGKVISYTVHVDYSTYLPYNGTSPGTAAVTPANYLTGTPPAVSQTGLTLSVAPNVGNVGPAADSFTIQWYRSGAAVVGKTGTSYTLTSADVGKQVVAKISYRKLGYVTSVLTATDGSPDAAHAGRFWIAASPPVPAITGDVKVGSTLTVGARTYTTALTDAALSPALAYQWYRSGVAISGATASGYTLATADKGKTITVRVTASDAADPDTLLANVATSAATTAVGTQSLPGAFPVPAAPSLVVLPSSTAFTQVIGVDPTGITSPSLTVPNAIAYQWFRGTSAISGATKATYTLTQADRGLEVWVRITTSHAAIGSTTYTTSVLASQKRNFTLNATTGAAIHVYTDMSVGSELSPEVPPFADATGSAVTGVSQAFQWYRKVGTKTTAIPGATNSNYYLQAADVGATITVRVTTGKLGYVSHVATYATPVATQKVVKGTLVNPGFSYTEVFAASAAGLLIASASDVTGQPLVPSTATQHATLTYQWYRNGVKISGATKQTYQLSSLDQGKLVHVVSTANLAGYNSLALPSDPRNYSLQAYSPEPPVIDPAGAWRVGTAVHVINLNFVDLATVHQQTPDAISYQWLRNGVAIPGAVTSTPEYTLVAADLNAKITARLTVTKTAFAPYSYTTPAIPQVVLKGQDTNAWYPVVQSGGLGVLTAAISDLSPGLPAPALTYRWLRNGAPISGATAKNYTLVAADFDKDISVQVTMTRAGFEPLAQPTKVSSAAKHTIYTDATTQPQISGTAAVGITLHSSTPDFFLTSAHTTILDVYGTYVFTWYRSGVAISGATASSYQLTASDLGKVITVKVTAKGGGLLAAVSQLSSGTAPVALGTIDPGTAVPTTSMSAVATHKVSVSFTGSFVTPGTTATYKWYRNANPNPTLVSGATSSSYTIPASDASTGVAYFVLVTLTKPGYTPYVYNTNPFFTYGSIANGFTRSGVPSISGTVAVGQTLTCNIPTYTLGDGTALVPGTNGGIDIIWNADGTDVPGATGTTFVITPAMSGHYLTCVVRPNAPYHFRPYDGAPQVYVP